jgi:hypothetical protein
VDLEDDPLSFFQAIPEEDWQCLVESLGQARLDELLSGTEFTEEDGKVVGQCIRQETFGRIMIELATNEVGDFGEDALICAWDILRELDLKRLLESEDGETKVLVFQATIDVSSCPSDEEVATAAAAAWIGELSVNGLRCLAGRMDAASLVAMFSDDQDALSAELIGAMLECGIEVLGTFVPEEGFPQLTPEQLACLKLVLDVEALALLLAEEGELPLESLPMLLECGLETLGSEGDGSWPEGDMGLDISAEDLACVVDILGEEALAEIIAGDRLPAFGEVLALASCDLDLKGLLNEG